MAEIKPFRGIRYHWEQLDDREMKSLVAPPYDVIDEQQQEELYRSHPANVVRLDLNRIKRNDNGDDNRYERARRHLFDWMADGTLVVDRSPTIYIHEQEFVDESGRRHTRRGFIALVRLEDYEERVVLPHERTLKGPKEDRLQLMKATECNLSQIFFLYDDPPANVDEILFETVDAGLEPQVDICTDDGICHRLWSVTDAAKHSQVHELLDSSPLLIADGHHRYETALAYRNFRRRIDEDPAEDAPYEYVMGFFVNMHDPGLQVFPTHRIVHSLSSFDFDAFSRQVDDSPQFEVEPIDGETLDDIEELRSRLAANGEQFPSFAMVTPGGSQGIWVRYVGDEDAPFFDDETPESVRRLDVSILHDGIFDSILGIDREAQRDMSHLAYVKSWEGAEEALDGKIKNWEEAEGIPSAPSTQMVVFMNPTRVSQVNDVCMSGGKMPQKSTYFYPKILSGLALNPL